MSYWSLLEDSRRRLTAGDFLEAERLYYEAREDHRASRLRAPIMEKGVEPLVRGVQRLLGREQEANVGPAFPTAADRLLRDLEDVAALHLGDARRRATDGWEEIDLDGSSRLGVALRMQRRSRLFALDPGEHWAVLRAYLHGCARHGMPIQAEFLDPELRLGEPECIWLADYTRDLLGRKPQLLAPAAEYLVGALEALGKTEDHPHQGEALALRCELLLFDPLGAPAALREGIAALSATHAPREADALLRRVGGLRCNEERLASPVAGLDALMALRPLASRFGAAWPPPELEELLAERTPDPRLPTLAALAWEGGPGDRVVLIQQEGPAPVDLLLLRPVDEAEAGEDPFASPMTEALARVEEWLPPKAPVLCGPSPPPWLLTLLGGRPYLSLEELEQVLPRSRSRSAPVSPAARHPLFEDSEDPLCDPWRPLVAQARELSPRLVALTAMPALTAEWGLRNLDSLGRVGIGLARRLAHALRALADPVALASPSLDVLQGAAMLEWPRLVDRGWPGESAPYIAQELPEGDLLIQGRPSAGELAGCALAAAPCVVIARAMEDAEQLVQGLVGHVDARRISVAPSRTQCPEPVFALLDDWIEESLVDERRALDVLWLYQVLASAPEGDLGRWIRYGGSEEARAAVSERLALDTPCDARCRLAEVDECWEEQLAARRRASEIWVEWAEALEEIAKPWPSTARLVCDDLVALVVEIDDEAAMRRLDGLVDRAAAGDSLVAWSNSAPFAEALVREFSQRLPEGRSFGNLQAAAQDPLRIHVAPPGYAPGSALLEEESRALLAARVQAWIRRPTPARAWMPTELGPGAWKEVAGAHPLHGEGTAAHPAVVVGLLGRPGPLDRVLALLRLSAAASHAQRELACVDPRLSELFAGAWAVAPQSQILTDPAPAAEGRSLLEKQPGRLVPRWRAPFDGDRLAWVARRLGAGRAPATPRLAELAETMAAFQRGESLVLGGVLGEDRLALAWTAAAMAEESRDGAFLGARFVVWVGDEDPDLIEGAPFTTAVAGSGSHGGAELGAALENGRIRLLVVPSRLLDQEDWRHWLVGLERCLLAIADADRAVEGHLAQQPGLASLLEMLAREKTAGRGIVACADQADISAHGALDSLAGILGGRALLVGGEAELASWKWQRVRLEDPQWHCSQCHKEQTLSHAHALCERCGSALLRSEADSAAAEQALRASRVRWLSRRGMEQEWLAITTDRGESENLLHDLGIVSQEDAAPLLGGSWSLRVVTRTELWEEDPPDGELVLTRLPESPAQLRQMLSRLRSRGRVHGTLHFMDHPLAWELPGAPPEPVSPPVLPSLTELRCRASRPELEFRAREALGRVERALRARSEGGGRLRRGLGPVADPREDPRMSPLAKAVEIWRAQASQGMAVERIQDEGSRRVARLLDDLESAGFSFEEPSAEVLPLPEILPDPAEREAAQSLLRWMLSEELLEERGRAEAAESERRTGPPGLALLRWREAALSAPTGVASALPEWPNERVGAAATNEGEAIEAEAGWILGVAGSGRTRALFQRLEGSSPESPTTLVVVAGAAALLRWDTDLRARGKQRARVLCVTVDELILDFLRCHHELGGFRRPPRVLAPAASPDGDDLRRRLLKETSRRYAVAAGTSPPVDLLEMRRVLEGGRVSASVAAAGQTVELDAPLLEQCAADARREGGWVLPSELGTLSRRWLVEHPYVGEAWRDRYPQVWVDDYDAVPEDQRAFLDRLFPEGFRLATADPALLPQGHPRRGDGGARQTHRLPRELTRAGETLLREELLGRGIIRPRSREKGKLLRQQVLNLEACARRIEEALSGQQWQRQRVGVVLGYSGDLPWLASRLREAEIPVWPARQVLPACSPGPRDFLLVLALAGRGARLEPLVAGSLAGALLEIAEIESSSLDHERLGEWLGRLFQGEVLRANHPAEAFLAPLAAVAPSLAEQESLAEAASILEATHLLPRVLRNEALASRLASYVEERAEMPWRGVLSGLDPAGLVDPLAAGPRVWLLEPHEMLGLELDRAFYLCTGHEPSEVHYRVLGRVRESLTVLYSETDPFQPRR